MCTKRLGIGVMERFASAISRQPAWWIVGTYSDLTGGHVARHISSTPPRLVAFCLLRVTHSSFHSELSVIARGVVTALKPVRAEQVRRPERKQNWTVPHCGSVLPRPIRLSLRPWSYSLYTVDGGASTELSTPRARLAVLQPESRHRRPKLPKHHPLII